MSFLKKLFGGASKQSVKAEPIEHNGYFIEPAPMNEGGQYRVYGIITKEVDGVVKEHKLIRADTLPSLEQANEMTVKKAKQVIAEQGLSIFG